MAFKLPFLVKTQRLSTGSGEEELRSPAAAESKGSSTADGADAGATGWLD